jgi:hypothetical protein
VRRFNAKKALVSSETLGLAITEKISLENDKINLPVE